MTTTERTELIADAIEFTGPFGFTYVSNWDKSQANDMIDHLVTALVQSERELAAARDSTKAGTP